MSICELDPKTKKNFENIAKNTSKQEKSLSEMLLLFGSLIPHVRAARGIYAIARLLVNSEKFRRAVDKLSDMLTINDLHKDAIAQSRIKELSGKLEIAYEEQLRLLQRNSNLLKEVENQKALNLKLEQQISLIHLQNATFNSKSNGLFGSESLFSPLFSGFIGSLTGNAEGGSNSGFFVEGGRHRGGLRIVGERGPELEATGPSRIFSASQTQRMIGSNGVVINNNPTFNVDSRSDRTMVIQDMKTIAAQSNAELVEKLQRQGAI